MACKAVIFNSRCVPPFLPVASSSQLKINVWCLYLMIAKLETYLIGFDFQLDLLRIFSFRSRFSRFEKQFALDFPVPSSLQLVQLFEEFSCPSMSCWTSYRASVLTTSIRSPARTASFSWIVSTAREWRVIWAISTKDLWWEFCDVRWQLAFRNRERECVLGGEGECVKFTKVLAWPHKIKEPERKRKRDRHR